MNLRFHASKVVFKFLKRSKWLQSHSNRHPSWENASSCEVPTLDETWQCQLQQLQIRLDITLNMLPYHWAGSLCHGFLNIADMFLSRPLNRWLGIPISLVYPKREISYDLSLDLELQAGRIWTWERIWIKQALLHSVEFLFQQDADVGSTDHSICQMLPRNRRIWYKSIPMANAKIVEQPQMPGMTDV